MLVAGLKRLWHDTLVAHPVSHGWILNLYRAGERHPQTVTDYFPSRHAPAWLAPLLDTHCADEARHVRMYTGALRALGQPVREMDGADVYNQVIRACTAGGFAIAEDDDADVRRRKLAHFLCHAHFLERRVLRSLDYHLEACGRTFRCGAGGSPVVRAVAAVHRDEARHVSYTAEAARELLRSGEVAAVFEVHRRAEARANLRFSRQQVRAFLRESPELCPPHRRLLFHLCTLLMEAAEHHV